MRPHVARHHDDRAARKILLVEQIANVPLRVGDELLALGRNEKVERLPRRDGFLVLQELDIPVFRPLKVATAVLIIVGVVVMAALGLLPIAEAAVTGAVFMVLSRCLPVRKLYRSIDWKVIFLLAGLIPMGTAMETSGAAGRPQVRGRESSAFPATVVPSALVSVMP